MADANACCYCRCVIKPHVSYIQWHQPQKKHFKLWERLINRQSFKVTVNTRVCSNHFVHGRPMGEHPHPELWLRGYETDKETNNHEVQKIIESWTDAEEQNDVFLTTRKGAIKRKATHTQPSSKKSKKGKVLPKGLDNEKEAAVSPSKIQAVDNDHTYCAFKESDTCAEENGCQTKLCFKCRKEIMAILQENERLKSDNEQLQKALAEANQEILESRKNAFCSVDKIKHSDSLMKLYTGVDSYNLFKWIYDQVKEKLAFLQYYKGPESHKLKRYQVGRGKKPGPERVLSPEHELLLTLMKLRLGLNGQFLGHLFGVSSSLVTVILSTWLPLLSLELKPLIFWPTRDQAQNYYPDCFKNYKNVITIIDCTEVPLQRPSLALANGQIYSFYKGRPTAKLLVACTPSGTVSFVSCAAGGAMSDKRLVKESGILSKFQPGDTVLADRGFNIQELLLPYQVHLAIPPFLKKKKQFSLQDDARTKQVANARIHIERVIGRLKDFDILTFELPLDMFDLFDHMAVVICAIVNLQEPIIPLHSQ